MIGELIFRFVVAEKPENKYKDVCDLIDTLGVKCLDWVTSVKQKENEIAKNTTIVREYVRFSLS